MEAPACNQLLAVVVAVLAVLTLVLAGAVGYLLGRLHQSQPPPVPAGRSREDAASCEGVADGLAEQEGTSLQAAARRNSLTSQQARQAAKVGRHKPLFERHISKRPTCRYRPLLHCTSPVCVTTNEVKGEKTLLQVAHSDDGAENSNGASADAKQAVREAALPAGASDDAAKENKQAHVLCKVPDVLSAAAQSAMKAAVEQVGGATHLPIGKFV